MLMTNKHSLIGAYIAFGIPAVDLITASVLSAPAALVISKLFCPETEESVTRGEVRVNPEVPWNNVIEAAAEGILYVSSERYSD